MLLCRGYEISETETQMDFQDFCALYGEMFQNSSSNSADRLIMRLHKRDNPDDQTLVIFPKDDKVKIEMICQ